MSIWKRRKVKSKQKIRRKQRRDKLTKAGLNADDYYSSGVCMSLPKK